MIKLSATRHRRTFAVWMAMASVLSLTLGCSSGGQSATRTPSPSRTAAATNPAAGEFDVEAWNVANDQWKTRLAACLRDAGFQVEATRDGDQLVVNPSEPLPSDQIEPYMGATDTCSSKIGDQPAPVKLTPERLSRLYDYYLTERECIIAAGHKLPAPPSRETFVATYATDGWTPFTTLPTELAASEFARLDKLCPQVPPQGVL